MGDSLDHLLISRDSDRRKKERLGNLLESWDHGVDNIKISPLFFLIFGFLSFSFAITYINLDS